jgi:hypothetical protein
VERGRKDGEGDERVSMCLAARVVQDAPLVDLRCRQVKDAATSHRRWNGGFADGTHECGLAVRADVSETCLVRRGGDGSGELWCYGPHGEREEWELRLPDKIPWQASSGLLARDRRYLGKMMTMRRWESGTLAVSLIF